MKRILALVLALTVLCGCSAPPEPTAPPTTPSVTAPAPTEAPKTIYDAASKIEQETAGALRAYPLGRIDSIGLLPMGDDLLLFSGNGMTTLTRYTVPEGTVSGSAVLNCCIFPSDPAVQANEQGVTYYDERQNALVSLDESFKEIQRLPLPEKIRGIPALSADCKNLYYCTDDALRCIDLETGLDRLVKEMYFAQQSPAALHCDDQIISCYATDGEGRGCRLYISTQTGLLLHETYEDIQVWTHGSAYLATHRDGVYQELLIGDSEQGPTLLTPHTYGSTVVPVLEIGGALLISNNYDADTVTLDFYELQKGKRTSQITLDGSESPYSIHAAQGSSEIWFIRYDASYGCEVLYCWDLEKTAVTDAASCLSARYDADHPDYDGLAECRRIADELSEAHGVQILLWTDATTFQPWDYTLIPEYQVPAIKQDLAKLEKFLSIFPDGFLETAAENTTCGRLQLCLVRSILANADGTNTVPEAAGLQYWDDRGNAYLSLCVGQDQLIQHASHEIFHAIDSRIMTVCKAYDDWNSLNPKDFSYRYDYTAELPQGESKWLYGEDQAFIDAYAMSFPREDRARIFEYAFMDGNSHYFESQTMQAKLRKLCQGIREGFDLETADEVFLWEQYLKEPLTP